MDALSALLHGPRAEQAFLLRLVMQPPWAVRVEDEASLTVVAVVAGHMWVTFDGAGDEPAVVGPGQVALVRGPDHYVIADDPQTPVQIRVLPGNRCEDLFGRSLEDPLLRGVRTWGNHPDGETVAVVGAYNRLGESAWQLLAELPPALVVDGGDLGLPVVELLDAEISADTPGQQVVLDRLLDLLTVSALRAWFTAAEAPTPSFWLGAHDPVVGEAMRLLQLNPTVDWSVAELARQVNVSRATLARRFAEVVGQPPMAFLTSWRMSLAADLLLEPGSTVAEVAASVGYASGYAFSAAFKRERGMSPSHYRREVAA